VGWGKGNISFGGAFRFAKYSLQFRRKKGQSERGRGGRGGRGEEFRHARAEVRQQADKLHRFRRLGIKTSKQNNFQFLLKEKGSCEKLKN
jgi:hypothetical protein